MNPLIRLCFIFASLFVCGNAGTETNPPAAYNVIWDSQSKGSADSMPLAGGNLGLNVWVQDNDLLVLMGSPNCMDENGMQVKLGLLRIKLDPQVFANSFRQELRLRESEVVVSGRTPSGKSATIILCCDVGQPVIRVALDSEEPVSVTISYESWSGHQATARDGGIGWIKRLPEENPRRLHDMKAQGVEEFAAQVPDPLSRLTLGGRLDAPGLVPAGSATSTFNGMATQTATVTTAAPVSKLDLTVTLRMEQDPSPAVWEAELATAAKRAAGFATAERAAVRDWWRKFWDRSHIVINPGASAADPAWQAGRNYQLIRYTLAANTSGRAMTLFNGGVFACDGNPDKRNWDGCQFMGQNQKLVYSPMLRAGDFDLLRVAGDFYRERTELRRQHAKKFWGVEGVTYPEPFSIFGLDAIGTTADGRSSPTHLHYHYTAGMTFALQMLGHDTYTGTVTPGYALPALGLLSYYDAYYQKLAIEKHGKPLDASGRLIIYPSDGCEVYHGCRNNTDVIAGLLALSRDLLAAPEGTLSAGQRARVEGIRKRIPEFTMAEKDRRTYYAAAANDPEWIFHNGNMDFPQMYICFPFTAAALGRSNMEWVKNTWELGPVNAAIQHQNQCWYQSAINMARMGETIEAAELTSAKLLHGGYRFPSFYHTYYARGGSFCHTPDMDHGGVAMTALQEMIMQTDGRRILLGAAWPREWNCDFKLHAPFQTTVEGRVADGKVIISKVTPESRRKDIEIFPPKTGHAPVALSRGKPVLASSRWHDAGYEPAKAVDGDSSTRWGSADGATDGWLEVDLGEAMEISRAVLMEIAYPSVEEFAIEAREADGSWKSLAEGSTIGRRKELTFAPISARHFRLRIRKTSGNINIEEFQLFSTGK